MKFACVFVVLLVVMASPLLADAGGCFCPEVFDPVCATNGQTYGNLCKLTCAHAKLAHKGPCRAHY